MPAFTEAEFVRRFERVQAEIVRRGLDALVVTQPENLCYVSGFWTPGYHVFQALFVPASGEPFLVVRNIEEENAKARSWVGKVHLVDNLDRALETFAEAVRAEGAGTGRIGLEVDGARQTILRTDKLQDFLPGAAFVPSLDLVERFRAVKSQAEIEYIRQATAMADVAVRAAVDGLASARTDSDVAAVVHGELARAGSEFTGSPPYVVGGRGSERSHALHAGRPLDDDGRVWVEVAGSVERYHGVTGRTVGLKLPRDVHDLYQAVSGSVRAMVDVMRPGVSAAEVDVRAREPIAAKGLGHLWKNRSAYSLGLSFPPGLGEGHIFDIKPGDRRVIEAGMVFHLIPIVKVPGIGAIGCSETVVVQEDGTHRLGTLPLAPLEP